MTNVSQIKSTLRLLGLLLPALAHAATNTSLYQTSFEPPAFTLTVS